MSPEVEAVTEALRNIGRERKVLVVTATQLRPLRRGPAPPEPTPKVIHVDYLNVMR